MTGFVSIDRDAGHFIRSERSVPRFNPEGDIHYTWGRIGFDGIVEVSAAGRGFSLASLKNEKLKINANNDNYALAAA